MKFFTPLFWGPNEWENSLAIFFNFHDIQLQSFVVSNLQFKKIELCYWIIIIINKVLFA